MSRKISVAHQQSVQVAVGVITNDQQQVLIAKRRKESPQGGLWEFPGGKIECAEDSYSALCRELREEVGIDVIAAHPLLRLQHDYDDYAVTLFTWRVTHYRGQPLGMEGQPILWVPIETLSQYEFPVANQVIIDCLT